MGLTERIGRPPEKWPFISQTIRGIFKVWRQQQALGGAAKKKRRQSQEDSGEDIVQGHSAREEEEEAPPEFLDEPADQAEDGPDVAADEFEETGHPLCTSQEDCQGTEDDPLIRHILNGKPGDVYCKVCWMSFLEQNPSLEGQEES